MVLVICLGMNSVETCKLAPEYASNEFLGKMAQSTEPFNDNVLIELWEFSEETRRVEGTVLCNFSYWKE